MPEIEEKFMRKLIGLIVLFSFLMIIAKSRKSDITNAQVRAKKQVAAVLFLSIFGLTLVLGFIVGVIRLFFN